MVHADTSQSRMVSPSFSQSMLHIPVPSGSFLSSEAVSTVDGHLAPSAPDLTGTPAQAMVVATEVKEEAPDGHLTSNAPDLSQIPAQTDTCSTTWQKQVHSLWKSTRFPRISKNPNFRKSPRVVRTNPPR